MPEGCLRACDPDADAAFVLPRPCAILGAPDHSFDPTIWMPMTLTPSSAKVAVSIVSYGTADLIAEALPALLAELSGFAVWDVAIVDNASPDNDADRMEAHLAKIDDPRVHLVRSPVNGGFAAGNNVALNAFKALDWTPDCVLLLNPDAEIRPGAIREMVRVMASAPRIGVVGAVLENEDGTTWTAAFNFPSMVGEFVRGVGLGPLMRRWPVMAAQADGATAPVKVDWVSGAAMLVRQEMIDDIGGMDEDYFLYFEEIDYMLQAAREGWETWHAPAANVLHVAGASTGIVGGLPKAGRMPAYWFQSWRRYFSKNHGWLYATVAAAMKLAGLGIGAAVRMLRGRRGRLSPGFVPEFTRRCLFGLGGAR
jgi:N-acetylglucosaminyl-diphospho-decaprenol L-rhamnosyltransferase